MPELPEVETTRRGLAPHLQGRRVHGVILRRADLRWPIPPEVAELLPGQRIEEIRRRAKYLLLDTAVGSAVLHLGMSGSLRVLPGDTRCAPTTTSTSAWTTAACCASTTRAASAACSGSRPAKSTRCCRGWARNRWTTCLTATTCSPAAGAAVRR